MTSDEARDVWAIAHNYWPDGAVFRYFARRPSDGSVYGCAISSPADLARTTDWADRNGYNSYWQPNPTFKRDGTRCSTVDILEWRWFMVDVDPTSEDADPFAAAGSAYCWLNEGFGELFHALWVHSGRGRQLLYPLVPRGIDPLRATRAMAYWLTRMNKELKEEGMDYGCTIDTSCSDLPRVMRMPCTINQKTNARAFTTTGQFCDPNPNLADLLVDKAPVSTFKMPEPTVPSGTLASWVEYIPHLTVRARKFLEAGEIETQRHYGAAACMLSLMEQGATEPQVLAALSYGAKLCEPALAQVEVSDMVTRKFLTQPSQPAKVISLGE